MELNTKLWVEDLMKQIREEIKVGFVAHELSVQARFLAMEVAGQQRDKRIAVLDKSLTGWRPKVDSSLSIVRLELTKLNSYFNRDAKATGTPLPGVLHLELVTACSSVGTAADGFARHHIDTDNRDCGPGRVFDHIHDPIMGMNNHSPPLPQSPSPFVLVHGSDSFHVPHSYSVEPRVLLGKLPKMNFPNFEGDHPKLWQFRFETYFDMYVVDPSVWVRLSSMHFEGPAACWLQLVHHRIRTTSWNELCSSIHEHFGRDQHEALIRQLFHIKQSGSV
jgi:hypothetical protein